MSDYEAGFQAAVHEVHALLHAHDGSELSGLSEAMLFLAAVVEWVNNNKINNSEDHPLTYAETETLAWTTARKTKPQPEGK